MTSDISSRASADLRERFGGQITLPGDDGYAAACRVWNAVHEHHPALIARPESAHDVQAAIEVARLRELPVCVRGGGHNHAGYAVADGALMLDLSALQAVEVDPLQEIATVGGGATWNIVDQSTQAAGLAVTGADVSGVGVGGCTLGGGAGWLHRKLGLTCDNLIAAEVVTADASVLVASGAEHPDLFWALRGGGGNFGVVTAFTFRLHQVGPVYGGMVIHAMDRAREALELYQHLCESGGDELFVRAMLVTAPPLPFIPEQLRGRPAVILAAAWFGAAGQAGRALRELRQFGPPAADLLRPMSYVDLQRMSDPAVPPRVRAAIPGGFTGPLDPRLIDTLAEAGAAPPARSAVMLQPLGGTVARISPDATPVPHRDAAHYLAVNAMTLPDDPGTEHTAWAGKVLASLPADTLLGPGLHAMDRDEPEERIRAAYGQTAYGRLATVKHAYDPDNVFRFNQNIRPQPPCRGQPGEQRSRDPFTRRAAGGRSDA